VWFGQPDQELRDQAYPYITIDMIDIGEDVNRAMRKLKKMINNEGISQEMRERESFEKPSMTKKKARAAARKRMIKQLEKSKEI
jgi:small subunit ribosomal protein S21